VSDVASRRPGAVAACPWPIRAQPRRGMCARAPGSVQETCLRGHGEQRTTGRQAQLLLLLEPHAPCVSRGPVMHRWRVQRAAAAAGRLPAAAAAVRRAAAAVRRAAASGCLPAAAAAVRVSAAAAVWRPAQLWLCRSRGRLPCRRRVWPAAAPGLLSWLRCTASGSVWCAPAGLPASARIWSGSAGVRSGSAGIRSAAAAGVRSTAAGVRSAAAAKGL
jgi:hypothetical protein